MRALTKYAMAALAIGLCAAAATAQAGSEIAAQPSEFREICIEQGGVFRRTWMYNDQGTKWGETLSCATGFGTVDCRGDVCRIGPPARAGGAAKVADATGGTIGSRPFPAQIHAFSAALSGLNANRN